MGYNKFTQQKNAKRANGSLDRSTLLRQAGEVVAIFLQQVNYKITGHHRNDANLGDVSLKAAQIQPLDENAVKFGEDYLNIDNLYILELQRCGSTIEIVLGVLQEVAMPSSPPATIQSHTDTRPLENSTDGGASYDSTVRVPIAADECALWTDLDYFNDLYLGWPGMPFGHDRDGSGTEVDATAYSGATSYTQCNM